jgi:4-hydroxy-4-methyl-2-oxoglutarate aldolase
VDNTLVGLTSAAVATAGGDRVGVIAGLTPAWRCAAVAGSAFTAAGIAGDNLVLHRALTEAAPASVVVAALRGDSATGHWGELMCIAAAAAGIAGVIVSAAVRDLVQIEARRFPVFHDGVAPRPAAKSQRGELGVAVSIAGVTIASGDLVVADIDGIAVVPRTLVDEVLAAVAELEHREAELVRAIESGTSTLDALGLPR